MPKVPKKQTSAERRAWVEKCWVTWNDMGFGIRQYTCFHPDWCGPVGVVWVIPVGGDADMLHVLGSYTVPTYRRRGVRTRIQAEMKKHCRLIHTWTGSKNEGGEAFLKSAGYTYDKRRKDWFVLTGKDSKLKRRAR
jgi:GNAT superfamily N-acetyltransferase